MSQIKLTILNHDRIVITESGQTVMNILKSAGIFQDSPCGGSGTCGKCKAIIKGQLFEPSDEEKSLLSQEELDLGYRLTCLTVANSDLTIELENSKTYSIMTDGKMGNFDFSPAIQMESITLNNPTLQNQINDKQNLLIASNATDISYDALKKLPALIRENNFSVFVVKKNNRIIEVSNQKIPVLGVAVDIGTTTVVCYFFDLARGTFLGIKSGINAQRSYGADVISRISTCIDDKDGLIILKNSIINQLNQMIDEFCALNNFSSQNIFEITLAGNTTMLHIAAGISPANIANAPFIAATLFGDDYSINDIGFNINPDAFIRFLPCVASYVGADITAGMLCADLNKVKNPNLYIDIGTNGEIALALSNEIICCSAAAGPAFEGANIKFGVGGIAGAISSAEIENGELKYETIENKHAIGICGSGLIDLVAVLVNEGIIDETGRIVDEDETESPLVDRIFEVNNGQAFRVTDEIYLTGQDIREVQLAKAAIGAGIATLIHQASLTEKDIEKVFLAGGFGNHINPKSATQIGLLPKSLLPKIEAIGNAAGMGASMALLSDKSQIEIKKISEKCKYIELSGDKFFQDEYIEQMMFGA
jgi:uncharacterized 2Fe-2S/4Fe-4S cluster protein (DUF4445 family)